MATLTVLVPLGGDGAVGVVVPPPDPPPQLQRNNAPTTAALAPDKNDARIQVFLQEMWQIVDLLDSKRGTSANAMGI
jgi:hypothetical protein